ncbi:MAG TPA: MFS transporter [Microlunatus sp.]
MISPRRRRSSSGPTITAAPISPTAGLVILCITETVSWGLLYYSLPAAMDPISASTGWPRSLITAGFSAGMLVAAIAGIPTGRLLDRFGPGITMTAGSVIGSLGLVIVAVAPNLMVFALGWLVTGTAKSLVLYQAAFAAVTQWYGERRVRPLTVLTLAGGFASTIFAPLVAFLVTHVGWRQSYLIMAAGMFVITVPLHALLLRLPWSARDPKSGRIDENHVRRVTRSARFRVLQGVMTMTTLGMFAVTLNLVPVLTGHGASYQLAAAGLGLVGVGQVAGRLGYALVPARHGPGVRLAAVGGAAAVILLVLAALPGPLWLLLGLGIVAGMARGCHTLVQATAVSDRWGTINFPTINGIFSAPLLAASALAPVAGSAIGGAIGYPAMTAVMGGLVGLASIVAIRT